MINHRGERRAGTLENENEEENERKVKDENRSTPMVYY